MLNFSVLHIITSEATGGLETYALQLISKLEKEGVKTGVYCLRDSIVGQKIVASGLKVYPARKRSKFSAKDIKQVLEIAKRENYNIIHAHTNKDMWLGSWAVLFNPKLKLIYSLYMSVAGKKDFIHRFIFSRVSALVTTSQVINEEVARHYPIHPSVIKLIRYGRDTEEYVFNKEKRVSIRARWNAPEDKLVVGTICRIDKTKGVRELASSFLELSKENQNKIQLWIIGDRTVHRKDADGTIVYEQQANEAYQFITDFIETNNLHDSIKLIPYQADLIGYLSALDIFVLASYNEMYSLAVIDAMLMERLVIGTNAGGTSEQIGKNERGILVAPSRADAIANGITEAVSRFDEYNQRATHARKWALAQHAWHAALADFKRLYEELSG
jgi:glycosyltransferase involved in cell wall biosynthesis